jgi:adenylate cyclase
VIARGVTGLQPGRESVAKELGLSALQLCSRCRRRPVAAAGVSRWRSCSPISWGFSSWAVGAGDSAVLELLRDVGAAVEHVITAHDGRIVKRLGDGLMATFLSADAAVDAALDAQDTIHDIHDIDVGGYAPSMRAGVYWGRPRKLGGDYLGVEVNVAARVAAAASSAPKSCRCTISCTERTRRPRIRPAC